MARIILFVFMFLAVKSGYGQFRIDSLLNKKVYLMFQEDQKWRNEYNKFRSGQKTIYNEKTITDNWTKADVANQLAAKIIIEKYGFPGYDLIGEDGSDWFWAIIQHSDDDTAFQQKASALMDVQVKCKNASPEKNALLKDRVLVNSGKKQIYGTQIRYNKETNSSEPFPIEDPGNVDKRRKAVGLSSLSEYLLLFKRKN